MDTDGLLSIILCNLYGQLIQNLIDLMEHKLHKGIGRTFFMTSSDGFIVVILKPLNLAFQRDIGKNRLPLGKNRRMPKSSHPAVSIRKGDG